MDNENKYNIVQATPFEDFEADVSRYPLYESIGELMEKKGKRSFIPHVEISKELSEIEVYSKAKDTTEIIIPSAELVIGDIGMREDGISSTAVGMMVTTAFQYSVPLIFFYEQGRKIKERYLNLFQKVPEIEYKTNRELLKKLETEVERFF